MNSKYKFFYLIFLFLFQPVSGQNFPFIIYGTPSTYYPGVTYQRASSLRPNPLWQLYIIRVDLNQQGVTVQPAKPLSGTVARTSVIATSYNAIAAVNGGFFHSSGSLGLLQIDDFIHAKPISTRPARAAFGLLPDRSMIIERVSPNLTTLSGYNWSSTVQGLGGAPNLLTQGTFDITSTEEQVEPGGIQSQLPRARTALGFTTTKQLILVVVDRVAGFSDGMNLFQLAQFMQDLGAYYAMNLDGGGSATMVIDGTMQNMAEGATERAVANALLIVPTPHADSSIITDNLDIAPRYSIFGGWTLSNSNDGFYNMNYYAIASAASVGLASTIWRPHQPLSGDYEISVSWATASNRATNATYLIHHQYAISTVTINQRINGGKWNILGTYSFNLNTDAKIILTNQANGFVISDAVRFRSLQYTNVNNWYWFK